MGRSGLRAPVAACAHLPNPVQVAQAQPLLPWEPCGLRPGERCLPPTTAPEGVATGRAFSWELNPHPQGHAGKAALCQHQARAQTKTWSLQMLQNLYQQKTV